MNEKQLMCQHKNFSARVDVFRITDTGKFTCDVKVWCADCELPFSFKGLEPGHHPDEPRVSVDGTEARLAIALGKAGILLHVEG